MRSIREVREGELEELLELYRQLHPDDEPEPDQQIVDETWRTIWTNPDLKVYGVFDETGMIASCTLCIIPNLTRGCRPYGLIENVVTRAECRRKGHGSAILGFALDVAWANGCYKVMLLSGRKDEATYRFYEAAGFDRHSKQAFLARPPE